MPVTYDEDRFTEEDNLRSVELTSGHSIMGGTLDNAIRLAAHWFIKNELVAQCNEYHDGNFSVWK